MKTFSKKRFSAPSSIFHPGFFWLLNVKLDRKQLCSQLDDMVAHGAKSVCIHAFPKGFRPTTMPSEMEPDYMTDGYMDVISDVLDHAEKLGMNVWLYDEGGWPSGGACGQVLAKDPAGFAQRSIVPGEDGPVKKVAPYITTGSAPYPSVIEKGTTETFIRLTHEKFREKVSRHFGKTLKFTFTDEPNMPSYYPGRVLCWAEDFAEYFQSKKHYDITPYLADLLSADELPPKLKKVRIDYCDVRADIFIERFLDPVRTWCRENKMLSGGHLNGEDEPNGNVTYGYGHILRALRHLDLPGVDVIWRQLFPAEEITEESRAAYPESCMKDGGTWLNRPFPKYASSASHQIGAKYTLSESFAIYGESITPEQIKWLIDYQMVRGVNVFVFAYYSQDNGKRRMGCGGPHFGYVDPRWNFSRPLFEYTARISSMLAEGKPAIETAVLYDIRSIWAGGKDAEHAIKRHFQMSEALLKRHCDFDFVDDDQIAGAKISGDGRMHIGKMSYSTIVLPSSKWMLPEARQKLADFKGMGGTVIVGNDFTGLPVTCQIRNGGDLRVCKRIMDEQSLYFITNEHGKTVKAQIVFSEKTNVALCDPETGKYMDINAPDGEFSWTFGPYASALFITGAKADVKMQVPRKGRSFRLDSGWLMRPTLSYSVGKADFDIRPVEDVPEKAVALGDWRKELGGTFSGCVLYRNSFNMARAGRAIISLGRVCHHCSVKLNGDELPLKFFGPFDYEVKLKKGVNTLEVTVANTLANAVAPDEVQQRIIKDFPPASPYMPKESVFNRCNNESGLYGPVTVTLISRG